MSSAEVVSGLENYMPIKERGCQWFADRFEKSFIKLANSTSQPVAYAEVKFGDITPEFYTPVVLRRFDNNSHEILINENPVNGYSFLSHSEILDQYQLAYNYLTTFNGFLFVSEGKKYLLISALEHATQQDKTGNALNCLVNTLFRYHIEKAFTARTKLNVYELKPDHEIIDPEEFIKNFDKMVFDDWTYSMAKHHGWTMLEWLRFRLSMQVPPKKK